MFHETYASTTLTAEMPAARIADTAAPSQPGSLLSLIRRIHEAVDEETQGIRNNVGFDIAASNARKSRYLYDLNRAARSAGENAMRDDHREALESLRQALARNEQAILAHLSAVREVADIIRSAIHRSETDGTYSAGEFGRI